MNFFDREGELADLIAPFVEPSWSVLDVGAGDGRISSGLAARTGAAVTPCDIRPRSKSGQTFLEMSSPTEIPCTDQAYHVVMMVFTLHHMESSKEQETLLTEALRVARRRLVILEDTAVGPVEWLTNRAFDYCLNVRNGVPCPFTFRSTEAWITTLERLGFCVRHSQKFRGTWPILKTYTQSIIVAEPAQHFQ